GASPDAAGIAGARKAFERFARSALTASTETLRTLAALRAEYRVGLVSNCTPPVPAIWPTTTLAGHFDAVGFSCALGAMKPSSAIYEHVCEQLGVDADACVYVGDGSGRELSGARRLGMKTVLYKCCLDDTYDRIRPEIDAWTDDAVSSIGELVPLIRA